ncbi:MAG TPA: hypothetical protein VGF18_07065 [Candidatus Tumulicola sp.]|jgi:hypothetical protein
MIRSEDGATARTGLHSNAMLEIILVALSVACFAILDRYIAACERI